jgi:hypothetical protein
MENPAAAYQRREPRLAALSSCYRALIEADGVALFISVGYIYTPQRLLEGTKSDRIRHTIYCSRAKEKLIESAGSKAIESVRTVAPLSTARNGTVTSPTVR